MAITFSGMSSYLVFTINSETYLVRPGAFGNSSDAGVTAALTRSLPSARPASASDVLQKSRRIIEIPSAIANVPAWFVIAPDCSREHALLPYGHHPAADGGTVSRLGE